MDTMTLKELDRREEVARQREQTRKMMPPKAKPFRLIGDTLPDSKRSRFQTVPQVRREMIGIARANPGQWVLYVPSQGDPFDKPKVIQDKVKKSTGGFEGKWEAVIRNGELYVRYLDDNL